MNKERLYHVMERQVTRLEKRISNLRSQSRRWSWARVIVFILGAGTSVTVLFWLGTAAFWLCFAVVGIIFASVVMYHQRIDRWLSRYEQWCLVKRIQLHRMTLAWQGIAPVNHRVDDTHPFEGDIDIVGVRSILRLIDLSVTKDGQHRLHQWLTEYPPSLHEIQRRQTLVRELTSKHLLRTQLLVLGRSVDDPSLMDIADSNRWSAAELVKWVGQGVAPATSRKWIAASWLMATLNIVLLLADLTLGWPRFWIYSWGLYIFFLILGHIATRDAAQKDIFVEAIALKEPLEQLAELFARLEAPRYANMPEFKRLCAPFLDKDHSPSHYLKRLVRIIMATGMRGNPLIWLLLNLFSPWDSHFGRQLQLCKNEIASYLPTWLDTWSEIETVTSLANLAYLNPDYTFPKIVAAPHSNPGERKAIFSATQIGHPLLPDLTVELAPDGRQFIQRMRKVLNDFELSQLGEIGIITGSNMSGKSTFLRTVGLNMALAYAGGPVNASAFTLQRYRLFSSMRVTDSVTDGISFFYAEVRRLRDLLEALADNEAIPVFFLIDEIYRGTNNRERLKGSRAYIRAVAGMNGLGLISTHDLELVSVAKNSNQVQNFHFRDDIKNHRMHFDYTLRPGPCPTTNALKIMAMEGLPVDDI